MNEKEIKNIMKETCYGSLSFCCDFCKECESRDNAIRNLGLGKNDIKKIKNNFDKELFKKLKTPAKSYS